MSVIKRQDIINDEAFNSLDELAKKLQNIINIGKSAQASLSQGGIAKVTKETKDLSLAEQELAKITKQIETAKARQTDEYVNQQKELVKLRKTQKELVAQENRELGTLEKLTAQNKALTEERKRLNLENDTGRKRLKAINEQLDQNNKIIKENSDALTKQKIGIGGYQEAIENASKANNLFSGGLKNIYLNFVEINQQQGGIKAFFGQFTGGLKAATKAGLKFILTPIGAVITAIVAGIAALTAIVSRNQSASDKFNKVWEAGKAILDVVVGRVLKLATALGKFVTFDFAGAAEDLADAFDDVGGALEGAARRGAKIADLRVEVEKLNIALKTTEASLQGQIRQLDIIADDATRSFKEREQAAENSRKLNAQLAQEREKQARKALELTNLEVKQAIEAGNINRDLLSQQADAIAALTNAENEALAVELENEKTRRELKQDRLERDLDILIDGFDNIKTINEKIIQDDKRVLEERINNLQQLEKLAAKSFDRQISVIKQFTKVQFDENDLLAEQDATILNEKIRQLGLSEIIEGRLLEIVRERRLALSDLAELESGLTDELRDQNKALLENQITRKEIESQITKDTIDEVQKRFEKRKEILEKRKEVEIQKEREIQELRSEIINNGIQATQQLFSDFTALRIQQISDELNALEFARNRELEAAGESEAAKFQINQQFDQKRKELQKKQSNAEKANALFGIIINTALGISKAFAQLGPIAGIPFAALIAATGAAQAAVVLAQKPPQFDKGTERTPKDYIAGEKRPEFRISKGKVSLVKEPTLFTNSPGDKIISGKETDSILGTISDITGRNILNDNSSLLSLLNNEMRYERPKDNLAYILQSNNEKLINTIKNKREAYISVSNRNTEVKEKHGNQYVNRLDKYYRR